MILIIGAGFAGASCAWWLTRLGAKNIVVIEREEMPGIHASGLNAGMARLFEEDGKIAPLAREGVDFIHNPPAGFADKKLIEAYGSLILNASGPGIMLDNQQAIQKNPYLDGAKFDRALWTPKDGIIDIHSYLWAFINGAKSRGAKFIMNTAIKSVFPKKGAIEGVETASGEIFKADAVINAAGAWAPEIAKLAGAEDLKIKSYRRHLFCTPPMPEVSANLPFVWDIKNEYYFRPESGGLLLGACDEEETPPSTPQINPRVQEILAEKLAKFCPKLACVSVARQWCGLRTFAPDRRPVVRWDKKRKNFFWLGALGGRGVTCAASVGRVAAEKIAEFILP